MAQGCEQESGRGMPHTAAETATRKATPAKAAPSAPVQPQRPAAAERLLRCLLQHWQAGAPQLDWEPSGCLAAAPHCVAAAAAALQQAAS